MFIRRLTIPENEAIGKDLLGLGGASRSGL